MGPGSQCTFGPHRDVFGEALFSSILLPGFAERQILWGWFRGPLWFKHVSKYSQPASVLLHTLFVALFLTSKIWEQFFALPWQSCKALSLSWLDVIFSLHLASLIHVSAPEATSLAFSGCTPFGVVGSPCSPLSQNCRCEAIDSSKAKSWFGIMMGLCMSDARTHWMVYSKEYFGVAWLGITPSFWVWTLGHLHLHFASNENEDQAWMHFFRSGVAQLSFKNPRVSCCPCVGAKGMLRFTSGILTLLERPGERSNGAMITVTVHQSNPNSHHRSPVK